MPCESEVGAERPRLGPFAPFTGRRWRQPDEGRAPTSAARVASPRHKAEDDVNSSVRSRPAGGQRLGATASSPDIRGQGR
ncbi:hypothetical protein EFR84_33190 [Rhizobium chutanense]|uniref:Uncharacterized protein n=1 Tax=Rhizobium chutanense TaxID=2035448 RepID=A0A3S0Q1E0_9HYPH|nr:hypothetical protein EFR84_33190 [Rhizobium chutanense]